MDCKTLLPEELSAALAAHGVSAFRGKQLFGWLHRRLATDFAAMSDLPAALRAELGLVHHQDRAGVPAPQPAQDALTLNCVQRGGRGDVVLPAALQELPTGGAPAQPVVQPGSGCHERGTRRCSLG